MSLRSMLLKLGARVEAHRTWPRVTVDGEAWRHLAHELSHGRMTLLAMWCDGQAVHMALLDEGSETPDVGIASLSCAEGHFPSVGHAHPPAVRFERAIADLHGVSARDAADTRPWLDHGRWGVRAPLGAALPAAADGQSYVFLPAEGPPLHQIPVGPVHAGIIEPGHFRFHANGETVVRLEERLGYVHKGIQGLMRGASLPKAVRLAGRISGDSTVAIGLAFARAVEAAAGIEVPARAVYIRAIMAELERIANHIGDFGAICNDAAFSLMLAHCGALRELVLRCAHRVFGHRLMMDRVIPGGVTHDVGAPAVADIQELLAALRSRLPELVYVYDRTASLQDRTVTTGILKADLARQYGAGGYVGRASGRPFDARRALPYAPYDQLRFEVPVRTAGDVDARVWIRIEEIDQSLAIIEQCLESLPAGPISVPVKDMLVAGEGQEATSLVEAFRGEVLAWVRLGPEGGVADAYIRDPSWLQWPLLEAAIEGNIVADFPLCNKSFNCSYSGHDI